MAVSSSSVAISDAALRPTSAAARQWRALVRQPLFWVGAGVIVLLAALSFIGPLVYPVDPNAVNPAVSLSPPSSAYPLGTDVLGRNELARVINGGQGFLLVGFSSALAASLLGSLVGLVAGYTGGWTDRILMRLTDIFLGIPQLVPLLLFDVLFLPNDGTMILILSLTVWPIVARLVRADTLAVREQEYVVSAVASGATRARILQRHILPNIWSTVLVTASSQLGSTVLILATASYLGYGLPPPLPNWAGMVASSTQYLPAGNWWLFLPPGLAFVALQVSIYFLADAFRIAFNPHSLQGVR